MAPRTPGGMSTAHADAIRRAEIRAARRGHAAMQLLVNRRPPPAWRWVVGMRGGAVLRGDVMGPFPVAGSCADTAGYLRADGCTRVVDVVACDAYDAMVLACATRDG